ncbi:hypothetical protein BH10PLA2_BH10PLA2_33930 [soil metagenome]
MSKPNYDDLNVQESWCIEQQKVVANYLRSQKVQHGRIGDRPAWHVAPVASIWAIEGLARPDCIGWWVICGDLPTDYISAADVSQPQHPRKVMRVFAKNWFALVEAWKHGREIENTQIADPSLKEKLAPILVARASLLMEWADNDSLWEKK